MSDKSDPRCSDITSEQDAGADAATNPPVSPFDKVGNVNF